MAQCRQLAAVTGTEYAGVWLRTAKHLFAKLPMDEVTDSNRTLVVAGDGERALRNKGGQRQLKLEVERILAHEHRRY